MGTHKEEREKKEEEKKNKRQRGRRKRKKGGTEAYFMFSETEDLWSWQRSGKLVNFGLVFVKAKA